MAKPNGNQRVTGFSDVKKTARRRERLDLRDCSTGHVMCKFKYGSKNPDLFPDGHCETVTRKKKYGPKASCRLTKLFKNFGLLVIVVAIIVAAMMLTGCSDTPDDTIYPVSFKKIGSYHYATYFEYEGIPCIAVTRQGGGMGLSCDWSKK